MYRKFFKIPVMWEGAPGGPGGRGYLSIPSVQLTVDNSNSESNIRSLMNSWNFQINNSGIKRIVIFCFAFFREISILQNISDILIALYQCDVYCTVHLCSENLAKNDRASL